MRMRVFSSEDGQPFCVDLGVLNEGTHGYETQWLRYTWAQQGSSYIPYTKVQYNDIFCDDGRICKRVFTGKFVPRIYFAGHHFVLVKMSGKDANLDGDFKTLNAIREVRGGECIDNVHPLYIELFCLKKYEHVFPIYVILTHWGGRWKIVEYPPRLSNFSVCEPGCFSGASCVSRK